MNRSNNQTQSNENEENTLKIVNYTQNSRDSEWDEFILRHSVNAMDLSGWRHTVYNTYGIKSHFLAAVDTSEIVGALALYEIKHPLFGHYLLTSVFGTEGGLITTDDKVRDYLVHEAKRLADQLGVSYCVIRTRKQELNGFEEDDRYVTAIINVEDGEQAFFEQSIRHQTRKHIRKSLKQNFEVKVGPQYVDDFHAVLHMHMRDLGSPVHSLSFYKSAIKHLSSHVNFMVVYDGDAPIASSMFFIINDVLVSVQACSLRSYNRKCPNYLLYWSMIQLACKKELKRVDIGRSAVDSNTMAFKRNWNCEFFPLSYNYYLKKGESIPFVHPTNPKYQMLINIWKRLPVQITKVIGPQILKGLG